MGIKLLVGLGNPGTEHQGSRHNAGFDFLDYLMATAPNDFKMEPKFSALVATSNVAADKVWFIKPQTYMNRSGVAVTAIMKYYKIDITELLVIHDDLDLDVGTARLKQGGGHGGHNGLRDIFNHLGSRDFLRLRLGIGHPGNKDAVTDYVLSRASQHQQQCLTAGIEEAARVLPDLYSGNVQQATQQLHTL